MKREIYFGPEPKDPHLEEQILFWLNDWNFNFWSNQFFQMIFVGKQSIDQGCQMVYLQTKNPILGKILRILQLETLVYFMDIWSIWRPFEIFYDLLVYFVAIWYIFPRFGILYQEKSGNPGMDFNEMCTYIQILKNSDIAYEG
jgi:hypothetical protein